MICATYSINLRPYNCVAVIFTRQALALAYCRSYTQKIYWFSRKAMGNTNQILVYNKYLLLYILLTQYCAGDKIEKNEMGWACGSYGGGEGGV